jgi:hypothetical protein
VHSQLQMNVRTPGTLKLKIISSTKAITRVVQFIRSPPSHSATSKVRRRRIHHLTW